MNFKLQEFVGISVQPSDLIKSSEKTIVRK